MDVEGRIITLEFDGFFVTQVYTPNAGDGLQTLGWPSVWDAKYAEYLATLGWTKPVLATGDYNVAHKEIDLANPASNRRSPGFTDEDARWLHPNLLVKGFTDTFRHLHGDILQPIHLLGRSAAEAAHEKRPFPPIDETSR